jgi:hypothetical protein
MFTALNFPRAWLRGDASVNGNELASSIKEWAFLDQMGDYKILKMDSA